jgi:hypothetical protein
MDLMMKAGEQKYAQQQQFAQSVGQMSALNATLTPGYRTAYMAPEVINRWDQKINEFAQKYSNSYDSPQAIMELYKLHSQWSGDPDVQLIKYDREVGNKEWDKMIEKTDTYATDINKNIDHATGMLKQFQSGNQYTPYSPLIKTQDTYKHWGEEFRTIEPTKSIGHQEGTYTDSAGVLRHGLQNVNIETRDPGMLQSKAMEIAKRIHDGTDQFALYHRESLAQGLGREPTMEEIYNSLVPIAEAARVHKETGEFRSTPEPEEFQTGLENKSSSVQQTEIMKHPQLLNGSIRGELNKARLDERFGKYPDLNTAINSDWVLKSVHDQLAQRPEFKNLSERDQKKAMNTFVDDEMNKPITYDYVKPGPKEWVTMNQKYSGLNNKEGFIPEKQHGTSEILRGSTVWDLDKGTVLQNVKDKESLTKSGNTFSVMGPVADSDIAKQPHPGLVAIEAGPKGDEKRYGIVDKDLYDKQRSIWNWLGYQRETVTKVSPVFAIDINDRNGSITYHDVSDAGTNGNDANVHGGQNALYFITREDPSDGKIKVDVYSRNPKNPDGTLSEKDHVPDIGLGNPNNPYLLKEYNATDAGGIEAVQYQVTADIQRKDEHNLYNIRDKKLFSTYNP